MGEPPYKPPDWTHPLCFPLATMGEGSEEHVIGLLRWPRAKLSTELPVIKCNSRGQITVLAQTAAHYASRLAAELDFSDSPLAPEALILANTGWPYEKQLESGSVKNFGRGLDRYLILRVAPFPDTYQALAQGHLERGDATSALITAEKVCEVFPEYGHLHLWQSSLLSMQPGYGEEARDAARCALEKPFWTLGISSRAQFESLLEVAEIKGGLDAFAAEYAQKSQEAKATKSDDQFTDNASRAMDEAVLAAARRDGPVNWASVRPELAEAYDRAALEDVGRLVRGSSEA